MAWKLSRRRDTNTKLGVILQKVLLLNTGCAVQYPDAVARLNKTASLLREAQELASDEKLRKALEDLLYETGCRFRDLEAVQRSVPTEKG